MIRVLLLTVMVTLATPVEADEITGRANAVDSTVIEVDGQRIMLFGIDSVMRKQSCTIGGKIWQCWTSAMRGLQTLLDQGPVTCETVGEPDVYSRFLAHCNINGESLNEQLVTHRLGSRTAQRDDRLCRSRGRGQGEKVRALAG